MSRGLPARRQMHLWQAVMQEVHIEQRHSLASVQYMEQAGISKSAEHGRFHVTLTCQGQEHLDMLRRDGEGHALLRFRQQNFPGIKPWIFEWRAFEVQLTTVAQLRHFSDRGR